MEKAAPGSVSPEKSPPGLPRVLGFWDIIAIVVGGVIGSGIFIVPAAVAKQAQTPLLILAVWVLGGLLSFFGALSFSELGAAYPHAGGVYIYLREAYGSLLAFLFGWTLFLVIDSGAIATLAVAFSTSYLTRFISLTALQAKLISVALIAFLVIINYVGVKAGAFLQNLLTVIKFGALVGVCGVVFFLGKGTTSNFVLPPMPHLSLGLMGPLGVALVATLWAYKGWESATYSAGETRNPERNLPAGLFVGVLIIVGIYVLTNLAYLYVIPSGTMAESPKIASDAMNLVIGPVGASVIAFIILFSISGAANATVITSPRVYFAMARDGLFFSKVAAVHPRFLTPHFSIVALGIWSAVLSLSGTFEQLFTYVIFGEWLFFGLTVAAVIILRKKRPDLPRPYKTWGYPVTPVIFILAALVISLNSLINAFGSSFRGLLIIALGIPAYAYWKRKQKQGRGRDSGPVR
jgi:APA family basic amino acid/polyamine antiporter